jgi:hypothetical protein
MKNAPEKSGTGTASCLAKMETLKIYYLIYKVEKNYQSKAKLQKLKLNKFNI